MMSVKMFITIDTEEDLWDRYQAEDNPVSNIEHIPRLQELFDEFGAIPTYLINYPVVTDNRSKSILATIRDTGKCEIGMHCHPWNTPPFTEKISKRNSMLCNLEEDLIAEKLSNLHREITRFAGQSPICFRAGRWGFSNACARVINELGIKVDTSVSPFIDWSSHLGPDFSDAPFAAYTFHPDNILIPTSAGPLLEVPPTIGFLQNDFSRCHRVRSYFSRPPLSKLHIVGVFERLKILNQRWLSPELISADDMVKLSNRVVASGGKYLNMSFHSTTLLPGRTPFVRNRRDLEWFIEKIRLFLKFARQNGFQFAGLSSALDIKK